MQVAERLDRPCVDVDAEVERVAGASIPELFATRGEAAFRGVRGDGDGRGARRRAAGGVLALGGGALGSSVRGPPCVIAR